MCGTHRRLGSACSYERPGSVGGQKGLISILGYWILSRELRGQHVRYMYGGGGDILGSMREGTFERIMWASAPVARVSIKGLLGAVSLIGMGPLSSLGVKTVPSLKREGQVRHSSHLSLTRGG